MTDYRVDMLKEKLATYEAEVAELKSTNHILMQRIIELETAKTEQRLLFEASGKDTPLYELFPEYWNDES